MPIRTYSEALNAVAEIATENKERLKQDSNQRRNQVVDIYGAEYTRQGDSGNPARFYISISPDMVYLERFQFKLNLQPFVMPVKTSLGSIGSTSLEISDTSLNVNDDNISPNPHNHSITPNPHTHSIQSGITLQSISSTDTWRIYIDNIDITTYLKFQVENMANGHWLDEQISPPIYPSKDLDDSNAISGSFDLIEVANDMYAEGYYSRASKLLEAGLKEVRISASIPFQISLLLYLKYSHLNR